MKRLLLAAMLCGVLLGGASPHAATPSAADYVYRTQPRDTLIGIGRRLLKDPRQWRAVQTLNGVRSPTRMPQGTVLRIPRDWLKQTAESATVTSVAGAASSNGAPLAPNDVLPQGARIQTGEAGHVTLTLSDGSLIDLGPRSSLTLEQLTQYPGTGRRDTLLQLDTGRVETQVKPQGEAGRFRIRTPVAVSAVRGTEFRRSIGSDALDRTEVIGGAVAVGTAAAQDGAGKSVDVAAGFGTLSDAAGGPRAPVKLLPPPDLSGLPADWGSGSLRVGFTAVAGAVRYRAQLSSDAEFRQVVAEAEAAAPPLDFAAVPDGRYWLRVRSVDEFGLAGADAVRELRRHRLPDAPSLAEPVAGAFTSGSGPGFRWEADAAAFQVQISPDPAFATLAGEYQGTDRTWHQDLAPGEYYWRAAGLTAAGERGPWSEMRRFVHKPAPPAPSIGAIAGKSLHLSWPARAGQRFHLQVARDTAFQHPTVDTFTDEREATLPSPRAGTYYARVQATDADGYVGPWSAPSRITMPLPWWALVAPVLLVLPFL